MDPMLEAFGKIDIHLLQYSGAIWYPMVYDIPAGTKRNFGKQKRQRGMDRCRSYIEQVGATWVVPSAGPPVFLDDALRSLNDDHGDEGNIFPDQIVFLEQMKIHGNDGGLLMIPGSTVDIHGEKATLAHPIPDADVEKIFTDKAAYIEDMAQRMAPVIAAEKASWAPAEGEPLLGPLKAKFEPIMAQSDVICDGIGYPVGLVMGDETVVLDFPNRTVREPQEGTASTATASASRPNWCAPCCATTNRTGSTRSSCPPASRRGASAGTTSSSTRSSSASPTSASRTPTAGSPRRTTTPPRSRSAATRSSVAARTSRRT